MTSPRGTTAARPPFFILRVGARPLGFIDFGDFKRLRCFLEPCFEFFHFSENNCRTKCFGKTLWTYAFNFFIFPKTAAGPGASEKPCGRLGRLLGALGRVSSPLDRLLRSLEALLEPPGALLGASWGLLRHSGGLPGASWAPPGPSRAVLEATQNKTKTKSIFEPPKIPQKILHPIIFGPMLGPKINQNRIQNEPKIETIFKSEKNALQEPLGAVLGRSWGILGGILGLQKSLRYRQA